MLKKIQHDNSKKWILWVILTLTFIGVSFIEFPYLQNSTVTPKWILISLLCFPLYFIKTQRAIKFNAVLIIWCVFALQYGLQCFRSYNFWDSLVYVIPLLIVPILDVFLSWIYIKYTETSNGTANLPMKSNPTNQIFKRKSFI